MSTTSSRTLTIITGASRGMGLAIARQLLKPQDAVLAIARNANHSLQTEAATKQAKLEQWQADLANAQGIEQPLIAWLRSQAPHDWHTVQLINNAGVIPPIAPLSRTSGAAIANGLRVGLEAAMVLTASFLHGTEGWQATRKVLNISSGLGRRALASQTVYCAAKAGMDHFTRCLALEEARLANGAKVCALAPGVIDTDMQAQLRSADACAFPDAGSFQNLHAKGQLQSPEAAATLVLQFLNRDNFGENPIGDVRD